MEMGFSDRAAVDVISTFQGAERRADDFRLVFYPTPRGCAAAYFPEANALMHRELVARESNTPDYKAMAVRVVARAEYSALLSSPTEADRSNQWGGRPGSVQALAGAVTVPPGPRTTVSSAATHAKTLALSAILRASCVTMTAAAQLTAKRMALVSFNFEDYRCSHTR
jgi:hypothetical protein